MRPEQKFKRLCERFDESESKRSLYRLVKTQRWIRTSSIAFSQFHSGEDRAAETILSALVAMKDQFSVI